MSNEDRSLKAENEIGRINAFFPILPRLGNRWAASRPWEGLTLALNLHLTTVSAALVRELMLGGGKCVVSAASQATTDISTVELLRNQGIEVYTGGDLRNRHMQLLDHRPDYLVDVGFDLHETLMERRSELIPHVQGGIEITRSGITKLRNLPSLPFPVLNINDGRLKNAVENRHGVGEAFWQAVCRLTGMHLSGRRLAVIGYGPVGRGLAAYAQAAGVHVLVVEHDPVRRLFAHYDGFQTPSLREAVSNINLLVTATGKSHVVTISDLLHARDGLIIANAGHGGDEIDVQSIQRAATGVEHIAEHVIRYQPENGPRIFVLGNGHPLNIVLNSGSPEPVLLHFAVLGLTLEYMANHKLPPGEVIVPDIIEDEVANLALTALET